MLIMLPAAFCLPAMVVLLIRLRRAPPKRRQQLSLYYRCLSVMLAYVMLVSPTALQQAAHGQTLYSNLNATDWSQGDRTILYEYDANGSVTSKTTNVTGGATGATKAFAGEKREKTVDRRRSYDSCYQEFVIDGLQPELPAARR